MCIRNIWIQSEGRKVKGILRRRCFLLLFSILLIGLLRRDYPVFIFYGNLYQFMQLYICTFMQFMQFNIYTFYSKFIIFSSFCRLMASFLSLRSFISLIDSLLSFCISAARPRPPARGLNPLFEARIYNFSP